MLINCKDCNSYYTCFKPNCGSLAVSCDSFSAISAKLEFPNATNIVNCKACYYYSVGCVAPKFDNKACNNFKRIDNDFKPSFSVLEHKEKEDRRLEEYKALGVSEKDLYFLKLAEVVATASKCKRAQYGSVLVSKDGRVLSTGYNGHPRGSTNDHICYRLNLPPNTPERPCCIHSEINTILFSNPVDRIGGTIYVSGICCKSCTLTLSNSGISRIIYLNKPSASGHMGDGGLAFIKEYGLNLEVIGVKV